MHAQAIRYNIQATCAERDGCTAKPNPSRYTRHQRSFPGRFCESYARSAFGWPWACVSVGDATVDRMLKLIIAKVGSEEQLEKEAFRMAAVGEQGCSLASDRELQTQLRQLWKEWLEAQDLSEPGLLEVPSGQPLYLRLLRAMLEAAGDPDRDSPRLRGTAKVAAGKRSMGACDVSMTSAGLQSSGLHRRSLPPLVVR